jgi:uncharacterized protein (DUF2336 family)
MTVATMRASLTQNDIQRLVKGDSPEDRALATQKICRRIDRGSLTENDQVIANQILEHLAGDTAELVRRSLAVTLKNSPNLPHDLAVKLARDVDAESVPLMQNSPVLTEEDHVEIVLAGSPRKQIAIADRETVSEGLTEVITMYGCKEAVETAALNEGACFSEDAYSGLFTRFGEDEDIQAAVISRNHVPIYVTEKLVSLVTGELFDRLVNKHELPPQLAIEIATGARERATLDLVEQAGMTTDPERFAQQLHLNGHLTPSLLMRSICLGYMSFAEYALAELAGVPRSKAWLMIHDAGTLGLKTIFERAGLPAGMFTAFRMAIEVYHKSEIDGVGHDDRDRYRRNMVERVLTQFQAIPRQDLDYLLEKLDALDSNRDEKVAARA